MPGNTIYVSFRLKKVALSFVFFIFAVYVVPVLINPIVAIDVGNVSDIGLKDFGYYRYILLWSGALLSLVFGLGVPAGSVHFKLPRDYRISLNILAVIVGVVSVLLKVLLIPLGVYGAYAFDSGGMTGGVWSLSMSVSELSVFLFAAAIASNNVKAAICFCAIISLNLLHGTRIFFVSAMSIAAFFYIVKNGLTIKRVFGLFLMFCFVLIGAFLVFIERSNVKLDWSDPVLVAQYAVSPMIYESLFSQLGLIDFSNGENIVFACTPFDYILDAVGFIFPRFLNPSKDTSCIDSLAYLQPMGALNGVLGVYAYFQTLSVLFFFVFGLIGRFFMFMGKRNPYFLALALYFFGSMPLRLVRDGPVFSVKFLSVACFGCMILYLVERFCSVLSASSGLHGVDN